MLENSDKTIFSLSKLIIKGEYIEYKFLLNLNLKHSLMVKVETLVIFK